MSQVQHPPLEPVRAVVTMLEDAGLTVALGGSAILAWLGLVERVGDWDVTVDADPDEVIELLDRAELEWENRTDHSFPFASRARFTIAAPGHEIDVLVGFALYDGSDLIPIPVHVAGHWLGLPIARPHDWLVAYRLMGRLERAEALRAHVEKSD